jgi:hypothetical protein
MGYASFSQGNKHHLHLAPEQIRQSRGRTLELETMEDASITRSTVRRDLLQSINPALDCHEGTC